MTIEKEKQTNNQLLLIIASAVLIIGAIFALVWLGKNASGESSPSASQKLELDKHPIPDWVSQYAVQCKGDITKLPPADQQKIQATYPGQSARIVISVAYRNKQ